MTQLAGGSSRAAGYTGRMRTRAWVRVALVLVGGLLLAGAAALVALGLHCMGCGLTRSAHSLLTGRPLQALAYNLFGPLAVLWLGWEAARRAWAWVRGRPDPGWWVRGDWMPWLIALMCGYMLLRNLPWWPFTLLAPHEL